MFALIGGLAAGFLFGVVITLAVWASGRRPYLRVDIEQHRTSTVVHHVVEHDYGQAAAAAVVPVARGRVVDPHALTPPRRVGYQSRTRREIDR